MKKIYIAADHAGFELKEALISFLSERGYEIEDCGAPTLESGDDYPDYCIPCAAKVAQNKDSFGIVIGGSGQGEAMASNRTQGARATVFYGGNKDVLKISREHNDANILSLGARFISGEEAQEAVMLWLETKFSGDERHIRRIAKLDHA